MRRLKVKKFKTLPNLIPTHLYPIENQTIKTSNQNTTDSMYFKQPQITYTKRWRSLQCSGGGDEMGGEETRLERLWRVAAKAGRRRQNETGSLDLKE
jgi:hypothetical protein